MENNKQPDVHSASAFINKLVAAVVLDHRDDLIILLRKHGVDIKPDVSDTDLITITYMGFAKSQKFKQDFINYAKTHHSVNNNLNYVDEDFFGFLGITIGKKAKAKKAAKAAAASNTSPAPSPSPVPGADTQSTTKGQTAMGQLLSSVATPENLNVLLNTGLGLVSSKLTAKADQKSIQAATALEVQKTQTAMAEAAAAQAKSQTKKWVTPVIIGVSLLAVGVVIYFIAKKKK